MAAVLVVCLALFGSRWGAYLGAAPFFLTDVLIGLALFHSWASQRPNSAAGDARARYRPSILGVLVVWAAFRLATGMDYSLVAMRDAVPYLYAGLGILAARSVAVASAEVRARTVRFLRSALVLHAVWFTLVTVVWPELPERLPMVAPAQDLHVFSPRDDFDTAIVGVLAADLLLRRMRSSHRSGLMLLGFVLCWVAILHTGSRAGLIGAALATLVALGAGLSSVAVSDRRKALVVGLTPLMLAAVVLALPATTIGQRLMGTFGIQQSADAHEAGGTTDARVQTWRYLVDYSSRDLPRLMGGVGFGPDFLRDSGALTLLVGAGTDEDTAPRSPHNYWLGTLLRLGLVGLVLFTMLMFQVQQRIRENLSRMSDEPLLALAGFVPVALLVPVTLGVILESPFGAVPFFWFAGILLAYPASDRMN